MAKRRKIDNRKVRVYKFRLYPTKTQGTLINKTIGCARFVFNYSLGKQNDKDRMWYVVEEMYQSGQLPANNWKGEFFDKVKAINSIKELKDNYEWLKEVDSIALQSSVENLANAYDRYYKHTSGRPKFNKKRA